MTYKTTFEGAFSVTPALRPEHAAYLTAFARTRRLKRNADKAEKLDDPLRKTVGLPIGVDGGFYVGDHTGHDILKLDEPPKDQPSTLCCWEPSPDGARIRWNNDQRFKCAVEWMEYLLTHFLTPWGYQASGMVEWAGEQRLDMGRIHVIHGAVITQYAQVVWTPELTPINLFTKVASRA